MSPDEQHARLRHFVEEMGVMWEEMGGTRMMGRVLGRLLVCDPPHQTAAELADWLDASRGSISTTTRQLAAGGMIERFTRPGDRVTYFRMKPSAWAELMSSRVVALRLVREQAERGLALLQDHPPELRRRLEDLRDFYVYLEEAWPAIYADWVQRRSSPSPG